RFISFLTVPAGVALALAAAPAVDVVYNWRSLFGEPMDPQLRAYTIAAAAPLGFAVFPLGVFNLLIRTFYIRGRVRTPVLLVLGTLTLQGLLYVALAPRFGVAGVAWATAAGAWLQATLAAWLVARREPFGLAGVAAHAAKTWLAAALAGGAAYAALALLTLPAGWFGALAALLLAGVVLALVYAATGALLGLPELTKLLRRRA